MYGNENESYGRRTIRGVQKMKYDYGDYTEKEVKVHLEDFFSKKSNISSTDNQTLGFMRWILILSPEYVKEEMKKSTILDWGCGTGIGLNLLHDLCEHDNIYGLDISENAIKYGRSQYPHLNLTTDKLDKTYDIIITSNCLEHFKNYEEVMKNHVSHCNKYYIVMVPFRGLTKPNIGDHISNLTEDNIPKQLLNFQLQSAEVIKIMDKNVWGGLQVLLIYSPYKVREPKIDFGTGKDTQRYFTCKIKETG